jgi:hypothetical protein
MDSFDVNVVFKLKDCTFDKPKNDKQWTSTHNMLLIDCWPSNCNCNLITNANSIKIEIKDISIITKIYVLWRFSC